MLRNLPVAVEGDSVGSQVGVTEAPEKSEKTKERGICALLCVVPEQTRFLTWKLKIQTLPPLDCGES